MVHALVQAGDAVAHLDLRERVHLGGRVGAPVVPLLRALPEVRKALGGRVRMVEDLDPAGLHGWMLIEDRADQSLVPVPVALAGGRGMQPDPAAAPTYELLQGGPLVGTQQVTRLRGGVGVVEDDGLEAGEFGVVEDRRIVGGLHVEAVLRAELLDRVDPCGDRVVPEVGDLGIDQDPEGGRVGAGWRGHQQAEDQGQECGESEERRR